ncbi:MAG: ImmA/IrrE family metallo-endopeptidase [Candidatus Kapabacteria bacterium]|nr:ImmA/IrrE family metallo-endopeptidase [Candidatus Kapabacteria bacterium]
MKIVQNIERLEYLLKLYNLSKDDFLLRISEGLKQPLSEADIFISNIEEKHLLRIDKIFKKGIHYYVDTNSPNTSQDVSIFFRKKDLSSDLNLSAKLLVNKFEELKISLSTMNKLSDIQLQRTLKSYSVSDSPESVANEIRTIVQPTFHSNLKKYLQSLIEVLAQQNIYVFEYIETWNKKEPSNIDGFYLRPNVIVLKRQQQSFRREIFTLVHELGHYLLNEEDIEQLNISKMLSNNLSEVEQWCNNFAFFFLMGETLQEFNMLRSVTQINNYYEDEIKDFTAKTHISSLALYTRLLKQRKITQNDYNSVKKKLDEEYQQRLAKSKETKELEKLSGKESGGAIPKPILSPLFISTIQTAYYDGIIKEIDVCNTLNIPPTQLHKYIQ